jgi:hypothetical protein
MTREGKETLLSNPTTAADVQPLQAGQRGQCGGEALIAHAHAPAQVQALQGGAVHEAVDARIGQEVQALQQQEGKGTGHAQGIISILRAK